MPKRSKLRKESDSLKAMVFEATSRKKFYSQNERQEVRSSGVLPVETRIWLGRYGQSNLLGGEARHLHENTVTNPNPFKDGSATTFIISRLVIQVATIRRKPEFQEADVKLHIKAGPWGQTLIQIWPSSDQTLNWPPVVSFSDDTVDFLALSRRFVSKP